MAIPGLEQLRDIHPALPPHLALWVAARDGWPLLLAVLVLALFFFWRLYRRRWGSASYRALKTLRRLEARFARDGDAVRFAGDLNALLRHEASRRYPEEGVRSLTGEGWLAFLDRTGGGGVFGQGPGRCLASLPYQRPGAPATAELASVVAQWLARG